MSCNDEKKLQDASQTESNTTSLEEETHQKVAISEDVVINFEHVQKKYELYKTDKSRVLGFLHISRKGDHIGTVHAVDDLSFQIKKGEAVAFLGLNGAGKSTTLKMVTGVCHQSSGVVKVKGRVSALLELTAGFDMQLTGRENIYLRGQIMGMKRDHIAKIERQVVDFAELGLYIDQPMRSYSSGMKARLGFAFAASVNPEILVVDEALSVGDRSFQRKCLERVREIMEDETVTVLFVTHSSRTAQEFCSRGIVLDKGKKVLDAPIKEAVEYYEENY